MAKHQRPSLEAFAQSAVSVQAPLVAGSPVEPRPFSEGQGVRARKDRPHTTLYLDKKVQKIIKEIALQYDRKPHDLYLEGIELMLAHYGKPRIAQIVK